MKKWHNTEELDELLGRELDLDQAWTAFSKEKKKTRRIPFWWFFGMGLLLFLGLAVYFVDSINLNQENQVCVTSKSSSFVAVPSMKNIPLATKETQSRTQIEQPKIINSDNSTISSISPKIAYTGENQRIVLSFKSEPLLNVNPKPITRLEGKQVYKENGDLLSTMQSAEDNENQSVNSNIQHKYAILEVPPIATLGVDLVSPREGNIPLPKVKRHAFSSKEWSLGINYLIANAHRNLSGGQAAYTQRRQEEQFLEVNKIEFLLSKKIAAPFFLQTGMTLSLYRSKLVEEIQTITSPVWFENVVTETHTQNNFTQEIIGTAQGSQLEINRYTRFQKHQNLSIPLRLGLHFPIHPRWQMAVSSGISFSVFHQMKGATFASAFPDGVYVPLDQLEYRTIGLLEGTGQVAIERSFGKTNLSLGLQGTWDLNNRFSNTTLGVDKFRNYGIHFGLRRIF